MRYGLSAIWLGLSEQRKLDGFYCRCLRRILRVQPAFLSRVSNTSILTRCGQAPFSKRLISDQLVLLGKVATAPSDDLMRKATFHKATLVPRTAAFVRKVGRPHHTWAEQLLKRALDISGGSHLSFSRLVNDPVTWKEQIKASI